ncbi:MAG: right-handed parallel beta-helix repeat-containing protein [Methanobacteriaceae archaeon]
MKIKNFQCPKSGIFQVDGMKKQMIFLSLTALLMVLLASAVSAADFNNTANNRTNFTHRHIQLVIDHPNTAANDTIVVRQGIYAGVTLNKSLSLQWNGIGERPVIPWINITAAGSGSRLRGLHIKNTLNLTAGITLDRASNVVIEDSIIEGFTTGILLLNASNNTISGNNLTDNTRRVWHGIGLRNSTLNIISGNIIKNTIDNGIVLWNSTFNTISRNKITENRDDGITSYDSSNNIISENSITNNAGNGIIFGGSNNIISRNTIVNNGHGRPRLGISGITLFPDELPSNNNTISDNNITLNLYGIVLWNSTDSKISRNTIRHNRDGIWLIISRNNTISGNSITGNREDGIWLDTSRNNTISGNTISDNHWNGIGLTASSWNTISRNNITDNDEDGIHLSGSSWNTISRNNITDSRVNGIDLIDGSSNNTISENTIKNSRVNGIDLIDGSSWNTISENTITDSGNHGISLVTSDNTIRRNSITGNQKHGIWLGGLHARNSIHFNRIIPVAGRRAIYEAVRRVVDASYNWYGSNLNVQALISGNVIFAPWLVLSISAMPVIMIYPPRVVADLRHDSEGTLHNVTLMDGIPVTFSATLGTVSPVTVDTTKSTATTIFTAGVTAGTASVSATVDTQTVSTPIQIVGLPTAAASPRGGNFYNNVTVSLTPIGGFSPVRIFFTTDGITPTTASPVYTAPLVFVRTTVLRFFAQDGLGTNSTVFTETYNIYRQVAYTYSVRVPVMRWAIRRVWRRIGRRWRRVWRWVRVREYTTEHRTGLRWERT